MRFAFEDAFMAGRDEVNTSRSAHLVRGSFPAGGIASVRTSLNASSKMVWDSLFKKAFVYKSLRSASCGKAGHHAHLLLNGHNFNGPIWRLTGREQPASQQTQARKEVTSISLAPNWAREPFFEVFVVTGPAGRWVIEKVVLRTRSSSDMPLQTSEAVMNVLSTSSCDGHRDEISFRCERHRQPHKTPRFYRFFSIFGQPGTRSDKGNGTQLHHTEARTGINRSACQPVWRKFSGLEALNFVDSPVSDYAQAYVDLF